MKKQVLAGIVTLTLIMVVAAVHVCHAGPFDGTSTVAPGKVALSAGYWYQEDSWKTDQESYLKTRSNQAYAQITVGLFQGWEAYLRLGGADLETFGSGGSSFSDNAKFLANVGVNGTFYRGKFLALGPFAQLTYQDRYKDRPGETDAVQTTIKDLYTVRAGLVASVNVQDKMVVYGGPFWNYERAKLDYDGPGFAVNSGRLIFGNFSYYMTLKNRDDIGGFLGVRVPITRHLTLGAEGQYTSVWAAGARLTYSF